MKIRTCPFVVLAQDVWREATTYGHRFGDPVEGEAGASAEARSAIGVSDAKIYMLTEQECNRLPDSYSDDWPYSDMVGREFDLGEMIQFAEQHGFFTVERSAATPHSMRERPIIIEVEREMPDFITMPEDE